MENALAGGTALWRGVSSSHTSVLSNLWMCSKCILQGEEEEDNQMWICKNNIVLTTKKETAGRNIRNQVNDKMRKQNKLVL